MTKHRNLENSILNHTKRKQKEECNFPYKVSQPASSKTYFRKEFLKENIFHGRLTKRGNNGRKKGYLLHLNRNNTYNFVFHNY